MIEAFHHPSPESSTKVDMEAARQAALRGRLLCFLGCLGRASVVHAKRLTSALRLLLSTDPRHAPRAARSGQDLWQLGKQIPLSSGPRQGAQVWRALHLPRLVRLVCQQLAASCAASSGGKAQDYAELWLQVWRSLVVLGLEFPEDAQLPELFSATAFALQPLGALPAPLQKAPGWRPLASEVLASCREIAKAAGSEEASWPVIRSLMARLSEEVQDAPERWQAADTLRERKHLRQQLAARQIGVEVPDTASRGGGQRRSLSDDDSSTGPRKKKKRIARKLFVGGTLIPRPSNLPCEAATRSDQCGESTSQEDLSCEGYHFDGVDWGSLRRRFEIYADKYLDRPQLLAEELEFDLAKSYAFSYSPENRCLLGDLTLRFFLWLAVSPSELRAAVAALSSDGAAASTLTELMQETWTWFWDLPLSWEEILKSGWPLFSILAAVSERVRDEGDRRCESPELAPFVETFDNAIADARWHAIPSDTDARHAPPCCLVEVSTHHAASLLLEARADCPEATASALVALADQLRTTMWQQPNRRSKATSEAQVLSLHLHPAREATEGGGRGDPAVSCGGFAATSAELAEPNELVAVLASP
eukprot:g8965.t1